MSTESYPDKFSQILEKSSEEIFNEAAMIDTYEDLLSAKAGFRGSLLTLAASYALYKYFPDIGYADEVVGVGSGVVGAISGLAVVGSGMVSYQCSKQIQGRKS